MNDHLFAEVIFLLKYLGAFTIKGWFSTPHLSTKIV